MAVFKAVKLTPARAWRTYLGGKLLDELHGSTQAEDSYFPEEWMMSVVSARNAGREEFKDEGLSIIVGVRKRRDGFPVSCKLSNRT